MNKVKNQYELVLERIEKTIDSYPGPVSGLHYERGSNLLTDVADIEEWEYSNLWDEALTELGGVRGPLLDDPPQRDFYVGLKLGEAERLVEQLIEECEE